MWKALVKVWLPLSQGNSDAFLIISFPFIIVCPIYNFRVSVVMLSLVRIQMAPSQFGSAPCHALLLLFLSFPNLQAQHHYIIVYRWKQIIQKEMSTDPLGPVQVWWMHWLFFFIQIHAECKFREMTSLFGHLNICKLAFWVSYLISHLTPLRLITSSPLPTPPAHPLPSCHGRGKRVKRRATGASCF